MSTFWSVAKRPKWIAALLFALAVATVFALLGQWQWQRSVDTATVLQRETETAVSLTAIATPQSVITSDASGRMVSVECAVRPSDDVWLTNRKSEGGTGDWLIRHCVTAAGDSLAIAAGWIASGGTQSVPSSEQTAYQGRYVPTESPQSSDFENGEHTALSVAELINLWGDPGPVYGGYLVLDQAPDGLHTISTRPPTSERVLNWLNIFYAAEWAIFAGFALYLWYRLARDEWERERESKLAGSE